VSKKEVVQQETQDKADSLDLVILRSPSKPFSSQIQCHENGIMSDERTRFPRCRFEGGQLGCSFRNVVGLGGRRETA